MDPRPSRRSKRSPPISCPMKGSSAIARPAGGCRPCSVVTVPLIADLRNAATSDTRGGGGGYSPGRGSDLEQRAAAGRSRREPGDQRARQVRTVLPQRLAQAEDPVLRLAARPAPADQGAERRLIEAAALAARQRVAQALDLARQAH